MNGIDVTVHPPGGFTNKVDMFACDQSGYAGCNSDWSLAAAGLAAAGSNEVVWADTDTTGTVYRLYAAGDAETDGDGDGLTDSHELFLHKTSISTNDSDGDTLLDGFEVDNDLDPNDATGEAGANGDPDGDGLRNAEEQALGTDPWTFNPQVVLGPGDVTIEFKSKFIGETSQHSTDAPPTAPSRAACGPASAAPRTG